MARRSHRRGFMKHRVVVAGSTLIAIALAVALFLRPTRSIPPGPELAAPERISPAAQAAVRGQMRRHGEQLMALLSRAVVLDFDGAARMAGQIFDEPTVARPLPGDELSGVLPEQFFALQEALHAQAKQVVEAAALRNAGQLAAACGALTRDCVTCHALYLHGGESTRK